jgi:hypothetical protein
MESILNKKEKCDGEFCPRNDTQSSKREKERRRLLWEMEVKYAGRVYLQNRLTSGWVRVIEIFMEDETYEEKYLCILNTSESTK